MMCLDTGRNYEISWAFICGPHMTETGFPLNSIPIKDHTPIFISDLSFLKKSNFFESSPLFKLTFTSDLHFGVPFNSNSMINSSMPIYTSVN